MSTRKNRKRSFSEFSENYRSNVSMESAKMSTVPKFKKMRLNDPKERKVPKQTTLVGIKEVDELELDDNEERKMKR